MSSRADSEAARLRRLRRLAQRRGLSLLAARKTNSKALAGTFMLSDDATRQIVLGGAPQPYSATIEEIENFLETDRGGAEA